MLIPILLSVFYFFGCFGAAYTAENKVVSSQNVFHIAVIFTPLIAFIVVIFSPKKEVVKSKVIVCKKCVFDLDGKHLSSPNCEKSGIVEIDEPYYS
jgi:hypothetical protein